MNDWVMGPIPHETRSIDVFEGTVCVILRNGEAMAVRGPGRHGGILRMFDEDRRLPAFGNLTLLTFARAPSVSRPVSTEVRLRDGATVTVTLQAAIVPAWQDKPETALDVVRRYGVQPARIQEGAVLELEESLRLMAVESLRGLTHSQVHAQADPRSVMKIPSKSGILQISYLLSCTITRDPHEERGVRASRDGVVAELEQRVALGLEALRRQAALTGRRETAVAETEIHELVGKMLGIPAVDVAYPAQRDARLRERAAAVRAVLEQNLDLVPILGDPAFADAADALAALISGLNPDPSDTGQVFRPTGPPGGRQSSLAIGSGAPDSPGMQLIRKAVMPSPFGQLEALLVGSGGDRVIGSIGAHGPHRILIECVEDPVDIAIHALTAAANWSGMRLGVRVINRSEGGQIGRILITRVEVQGAAHPGANAAIGAWIAATNALLAGTVVVSIAEDDS